MSKFEIPDSPTMSVPAAGRLAGLGEDASYAAAAQGQIPVIQLGRRKRVPTKIWLRKLGLKD